MGVQQLLGAALLGVRPLIFLRFLAGRLVGVEAHTGGIGVPNTEHHFGFAEIGKVGRKQTTYSHVFPLPG